MRTLQAAFENRNGHTLRGIVTLPDTEEKVPMVLLLHGFSGNLYGYKGLNTRIARALANAGIGCARFDFYGNGESDGEFQDMRFTGLYEDAEDMFSWMQSQPYADATRCWLSGQSMGGYVAASTAPSDAAVFSSLLTPAAAVGLLMFFVLSSPCFATMGAMRKELGSRKEAARAVGFQMISAYLVAIVAYQIFRLFL